MLTVVAAKSAVAQEKDYKLADVGGLYVFARRKGTKAGAIKIA